MRGELNLANNKLIGLAAGMILGVLAYFFGALEIVKLIIALVVLWVIIQKPIYAVILYILSIPFVSDMNALLMGIAVIISYIINFIKEGNFKFKFTPANLLLLLFAIIVIADTFLSVTPQGSFRDFSIHIISIGIVFMLIHSKSNRKEAYLLNTMLVLIATAVSIYGIYQFFNGVQMGSGWLDVSQNPDIEKRVYSTFENPNLLAEYLIMVIPISIALFFYNRNYISKIFFALTSFIMLICLGVTYSRGGYIGLAFSILIFILLIDFKKLILFIPGGIGALFLMPTSILQRISTIGSLEDSSNFYRFNLWNMAMDILKDYWFSGVGLGYIAFQEISPFYIKTMAPYHTHNTYLQIAIELGAIGLIVFLLLILSIFKMAVGRIVESKSRYTKYFTVAYIASLSAILVHGMAEHVLYNPKIILFFWFVVGLNLYSYNTFEEENK